MSTLSLIPFGQRLSDQQFVDVSDVKRGGKCNCICPSCKTPLIARQGDINEWHFAHASKGVFSDTESECEYSFWLSVTLMAKQVIKTAKSIQLPSLIMYTNDAVEVKVSEQAVVLLDEVQIDQKVNAVSVDATLKLGEYIIAVIFTTPYSHCDNYACNLSSNDHVGILEISLENSVQWLFGSNNQGKYAEVLKSKILEDNDCKKWRYHPRKLVIESQKNMLLNEQCPVLPLQQEPEQHFHTIEKRQYKCIKCGNNWFGTHICSNCKTHLYTIS
ncbi:MAG: hypothetical protein GY787_15545 [Alteromonadales bacterium]|nr:hypothetical protein [Alteromonadales bacterium]MCP4987480.1 hypothetical protein [Colwellia sp.]